MPLKTMEELFHLTQEESGIQSQDAYPDVSADPAFIELYRYQIPVDRKLKFKPGHTFALLARKLPDQAVDGAIADDGGTQVYETEEANEDTGDDMTLLPATPAVGDAYYFAYRYPFDGLTLKYSTAGDGVWTIVWEYYNGSSWTTLPGITDGTSGFTATAGTYDVTWTRPKDWAATAVKGLTAYWVRARVSAYTSVTTQPTGDQAWIHPDPTAMENTDKVRVEVRTPNELSRKPLIEQAMYSVVDEFTDRDLMYRLDLNEEVLADGGFWIVVLVKAKSPIDVSACYFDLTCDRVRQAII